MALSFTVSPSSVTVGDWITIRITGRGSDAVIVDFSYNGSSKHTVLVTEDSASVKVEQSWMSGISTASAALTVEAEIWGGGETAAVSRSLTVTASESMRRPSVWSVAVEPVQPQGLSRDYADDYIASLTMARVSAGVTAKYGATISAVTLRYPGGADVSASYDSASDTYVAVSPAVTGDTVFTVTAMDSNGRQDSASVSVTGVIPYTPPAAALKELYRCDSAGQAQEGGAYYKIRVEASVYTGLSGNSLRKLTAGLKNQAAANLTSGTAAVLGGSLSLNSAYTVVVTVQDQISGEVVREFRLPGRLRDLVLLRGTGVTHLGVGVTPTDVSGHTTIQLPAGAQLLIDGVDVLAALEARLSALES